MMMSSDNNIPLESENLIIDNKVDNKLSKDEECEYYKQRFSCLKIVQEDIQNQLSMYKERCRGVSAIQLLLRESRQENVKLSKHVKALETAISILQKRLEKNGLSNSVIIQDAELFAPSASKQTLDNLAKETARLRSLLKQDNGLFGKKSSDEMEEIKVALEEADSENNELKNTIKDMEEIKLKLVSDYERAIEKLTKEIQEGKENFERELKAKEENLMKESESRKNEMMLTNSGDVQELKNLLIKTVEKCSILNEQLPIGVPGAHVTPGVGAANKKTMQHSVPKEDYDRLELKHQEAMQMNQRWQMYSKEQEKQFQNRIQELSDPHSAMNEKIAMDLNHKDAEILELRKQIAGLSKDLEDSRNYQAHLQQDNSNVEILRQQIVKLTKDLTDARNCQAHMRQENSTVEILKQQIQVCTEDFNTERKDREQAVQKARALQEDVTKLTTEITGLKRQVEQLKKAAEQPPKQLNKPPSYEASLSSSSGRNNSPPPPQYSSTYVQGASPWSPYPQSVVAVQETPTQSVDQAVAIPFSTTPSPASIHNAGHWSPVLHPDMRNYDSMPRQAVSNSNVSSSTNYPSMSRLPSPIVQQASSTPPFGNSANYDTRNYATMSRSPVSSMSGPVTPPVGSNIPTQQPLLRRGGSAKEEIPCPKCNRKFSDGTIVSHMESCTQ